MFKRAKPLPTIERIRALLDYDMRTGAFRWKVGRPGSSVGALAGHLSAASGYWFIRVDGVLLRSHRVAWAWVKGVWPEVEIDHRDKDKSNCRFGNLREATRLQNAANRGTSTKNTSGVAGVSLTTSRRRYRAEIRVGRRRIHLGYFSTLAEAAAAREIASREHRGEFSP